MKLTNAQDLPHYGDYPAVISARGDERTAMQARDIGFTDDLCAFYSCPVRLGLVDYVVGVRTHLVLCGHAYRQGS